MSPVIVGRLIDRCIIFTDIVILMMEFSQYFETCKPTADDRDRLERSNLRYVRAGFLPADAATVDTVSERADNALFGAIILDRRHVLRHLCQERSMIRCELRTYNIYIIYILIYKNSI